MIDTEGNVYIVKSNKLDQLNVVQEFRSTNTSIVSGIPEGTILLSDPISGAYIGMAVSVGESREQ